MDMEKDELLGDVFLRNLIQKSSVESPSDDFVERVMGTVQMAPEIVSVRKPFMALLKSVLPYFGLGLFFLFVCFTSDFPFMNWLPGKGFFTTTFLTYFSSIIIFFKGLFASKFVGMGITVVFSACFLVLIEYLFRRRTSVEHHFLP